MEIIVLWLANMLLHGLFIYFGYASIKNYGEIKLLTFISIGIIIPILEESFFRCTLNSLFGDYSYFRLVNASLFGLAHATNYTLHRNIYLLGIQCFMTWLLGWYLDGLNNIVLAISYHILYNILGLGSVALLGKVLKKDKIYDTCNSDSINVFISRRRSYPDLSEKFDWKNIKLVKITGDLKESFNRYDKLREKKIVSNLHLVNV